jgi:hypothetical protein
MLVHYLETVARMRWGNAHLWVSAPLLDEVVTIVTLAIALFVHKTVRGPKAGNSQARVQNSRYATPRCLTVDDS